MGGVNLGLSSSKGSSKQTSKPAQWVEDASKRGVKYAEDALNRGYQGYDQPRVANLGANEVQAGALAGRDTYSQYLDSANDAYGRAGTISGTSAAAGIDQYINPYREKVLDISNRKLGENYDASLAALRGSAASRGAFGGSRQTMLESNLKRDMLQAQGDLYAKGLDAAYTTALGASQADLARQLQGALSQGAGYNQLATSAAGLNADQIRALMATGEAERGVRQGALDAQYEDFLRGQAYDQDALDRFLGSIRAGDYSRSGTGSSKESGMSLGMKF